MRTFVLILLSQFLTTYSSHIIYLKSGEEVEGEIISALWKQLVLNQEGIGKTRIPYENIAAIRISGELQTGIIGRKELEAILPNLKSSEPTILKAASSDSTKSLGWEFKEKTKDRPEGHYLTIQGLQSIAYLRPVITFNYEWVTNLPVHLTGSICFENRPSGSPDTAFQGEIFGIGVKGGARKYFLRNPNWYFEADLTGFHFFNGMVGGNRSYIGAGPFLGYKTMIEKVVLDANVGWVHVFNEPQVLPDIPEDWTGNSFSDEILKIHFKSLESSVKNSYPYMRLEANIALGFKI